MMSTSAARKTSERDAGGVRTTSAAQRFSCRSSRDAEFCWLLWSRVRASSEETHLDREIVDRATALVGVRLGRRIGDGPFEERDARAEEGDLFFLFFELTALFFDFFVGDALAVVVVSAS